MSELDRFKKVIAEIIKRCEVDDIREDELAPMIRILELFEESRRCPDEDIRHMLFVGWWVLNH